MLNYVRYYLNELKWRFEQKDSSYYSKERKYGNNMIHTVDDTNIYIKKLIASGEPFMLGRFGSVESYNMKVTDLKIRSKYENAMDQLCTNAGFFPKKHELVTEFVELMKDCCRDVDVIAVWKMFMEEHYIKNYMAKNVYTTYLLWMEPWYSTTPWTEALKGKKVLVIHPFADTIRSQYQKREKLFLNHNVLPEFELKTLRAVQTICGEQDNRFETWFDALDWMYKEALKIDFDIAIIGCGAYGFPLAAKLKRYGKQAIHMGGATQLLFGIKGKRWDNDPLVSKLYNEAWTRPDERERPTRANDVEKGCYW